jgi:transcriptional regulator with XRE-family HTH domain
VGLGLTYRGCDVGDQQYDLSAKLCRLMDAAGNPSTERLAEQIREHTGTGISGAYLWQIKRGKRANLTLQHLTALASYFSDTLGVRITLSYFDPTTPVDEPWSDPRPAVGGPDADERAFAEAMRDRGVRRIAARYGSMDPVQQRQLLAIADAIANVRDERDPEPER